MKKTTEKESLYQDLELKGTRSLLDSINREDAKVANAVQQVIPEIERFVESLVPKMTQGGRLFYIGAGTSGRLGILDASECPPTFGVDHNKVIGLIAGGDSAIRKAVEFAEDDTEQGIRDLDSYQVNELDSVVGIAASGTTPYVIGALKACQERGIITAALTCNPGAPILDYANHKIVAEVGPEFVTGSTRMKSGTAQKLILNMISTATMIRLGHVKGNRMVDMQLSNDKLVERGTQMIMEQTKLSHTDSSALLLKYGSVRKAVDAWKGITS